MKRKDNAGLHITLTFLVLLPRKTGTSTRKVSCHIVLFCMVALEVCSCAQNLFILHSIHVQTTLPLWRTVAVRNVGAKYWNMPHEISADSDTGSMSLLCTLFLTWKQTLLLPPLPPLVLTFKEYLNVRQMSSCQGGCWLHCFPIYLYLDSPTQMEAKSTFFLRAWRNHTFKILTNLEMINKHMTN